MSETDLPDARSSRSFSKRLILGNIAAAWLVLIASVPYGQAQAIVGHVFSFITVLIGIYTGIGHLDYRKVLEITGRASERHLPGERQ